MSKRANHVRPIPGAQAGACAICGNYVQITAGCLVTRLMVGACCRAALEWADDVLSIHGRRAGIIHPTADNYSQS